MSFFKYYDLIYMHGNFLLHGINPGYRQVYSISVDTWVCEEARVGIVVAFWEVDHDSLSFLWFSSEQETGEELTKTLI